MAGNLDREFGPDHNVTGPVSIFVPPEISGPLGAGVGKKLQEKGIKVVLSILSHTVEAVTGKGLRHKYSVGWSTMTAKDNEQLVSQIGKFRKDWNIDGIDIDDEYGPDFPDDGAKNFYETVRAGTRPTAAADPPDDRCPRTLGAGRCAPGTSGEAD
jgi:Glycosyl hydrolases family 18